MKKLYWLCSLLSSILLLICAQTIHAMKLNDAMRPLFRDEAYEVQYNDARNDFFLKRYNDAENKFKSLLTTIPYRLDTPQENLPKPINLAALDNMAYIYLFLATLYINQKKYQDAKPYLKALSLQDYNTKIRDKAIRIINALNKLASALKEPNRVIAAQGLLDLGKTNDSSSAHQNLGDDNEKYLR